MPLGLRVGEPFDEVAGAWLAKESARDIYLVENPDDAATLVDKSIVGCLEDNVEEILVTTSQCSSTIASLTDRPTLSVSPRIRTSDTASTSPYAAPGLGRSLCRLPRAQIVPLTTTQRGLAATDGERCVIIVCHGLLGVVGQVVRALLYRVPMHVRRATAVHKAERTRGLPPRLDDEILEHVVRQFLGGAVASVSYEHLSNWKPTGAYRVIVENGRGRPSTLIFKNADYSLDSVPAQEELPVTIGAPEFAVMSGLREPLRSFLPEVYWTDDVGEQCFRYLMEDLHWRWYRPTRGRDILAAAQAIPRLHAAIRAVVDPEAPGLIHYDEAYSSGLRVYVVENVVRYLNVHPDDDSERLWEEWPRLESAHIVRVPDPEVGGRLIHGDFNIANLYLHWRSRNRLKAVDWEWCGLGYPHTDLASVLKHASSDVVEKAINDYSSTHPEMSPVDHRRAYAWCRLQDAIRDAGYVAAQFTDFEHRPRVKPSAYLARTLRRARSAVDILERTDD